MQKDFNEFRKKQIQDKKSVRVDKIKKNRKNVFQINVIMV